MPLTRGTEMPDVTLPRETPEDMVSLSSFVGDRKLLLLFLPMAFTSVCTDELCTVTDELERYKSLGAKVVAISVDSPFVQAAWKEDQAISIDLLSDFNREAIEAFDVKRDELLGLNDLANRSAFVVDDDGVIQYSWESDDPSVLPDFDTIKSVLEDLSE